MRLILALTAVAMASTLLPQAVDGEVRVSCVLFAFGSRSLVDDIPLVFVTPEPILILTDVVFIASHRFLSWHSRSDI